MSTSPIKKLLAQREQADHRMREARALVINLQGNPERYGTLTASNGLGRVYIDRERVLQLAETIASEQEDLLIALDNKIEAINTLLED